jgi:hypothetical protein
LVDLGSAPRSDQRDRFLRDIGRRGRFDYLNAIPDGNGNSLSFGSPAKGDSSVNDSAFRETRPPSHYGLNE